MCIRDRASYFLTNIVRNTISFTSLEKAISFYGKTNQQGHPLIGEETAFVPESDEGIIYVNIYEKRKDKWKLPQDFLLGGNGNAAGNSAMDKNTSDYRAGITWDGNTDSCYIFLWDSTENGCCILYTSGSENVRPVNRAVTVTAAGTSYIYDRPSLNGKKVASVQKWTHLYASVSLPNENSQWYRVENAEGKRGYFPASRAFAYLGGNDGDNCGAVAVTGAILRASASDSGAIVEEVIPRGTSVVIRSITTDSRGQKWYYVATVSYTHLDREDILFGIKEGFDFIAASFTRTAEDVLEIRKILDENGGRDINIIAKIENQQGVDNIDSRCV